MLIFSRLVARLIGNWLTYSAVPAIGFYPSLNLRLSFAQPSSHTRLCLLADFPSLNLRLGYAKKNSH
ncbi:hypothetical protein [Capnocytophaga bilenii]